MRQGLRRSDRACRLRHRQARQPLRRGHRADPLEAYRKAFKTDPTSAFGGIIAFNVRHRQGGRRSRRRPVRRSHHRPEITAEARAVFAAKQNLRVLSCPWASRGTLLDYKRVGGGLLVQSADEARITQADIKVVTKRAPTAQEMTDLLFAWRVAKYVKSNAIVYCKDGMTTASAPAR
jgi:phosphoribosylaminoimidazolecarboxamide formyltransferase/IMP cyclohydrolase